MDARLRIDRHSKSRRNRFTSVRLDRLVEHDDLLDTAVELARQMNAWPPLAVRMSKRALQHNQECELEEALRYELVAISHAGRAVNDRKESLAAFREKRTPRFTGT